MQLSVVPRRLGQDLLEVCLSAFLTRWKRAVCLLTLSYCKYDAWPTIQHFDIVLFYDLDLVGQLFGKLA